MALVKRFHINFNDSPLTGVNTPGSDENRLKLKWMNWCTISHMLLPRLDAEKMINVADEETHKYRNIQNNQSLKC